MGRINYSRVLLGGLLAGLLINIGEFLLNGVVLEARWRETMASLNRPPVESVNVIVGFNIVGFAIGIFTVWLYAAIRPRFGAGPRTASCAGLAVWFASWLIGLSAPLLTDMFPRDVIVISLVWGFVEIMIASVAGAWVYKEEEAAAGVAAMAGGD